MERKDNLLEFEASAQVDRMILAGVRYGIRVKTFRRQELTEDEEALASRIDDFERGSRTPDNTLSLSPADAGVATDAIKRNLEFQETNNTWHSSIGDRDRVALPVIERFSLLRA